MALQEVDLAAGEVQFGPPRFVGAPPGLAGIHHGLEGIQHLALGLFRHVVGRWRFAEVGGRCGGNVGEVGHEGALVAGTAASAGAAEGEVQALLAQARVRRPFERGHAVKTQAVLATPHGHVAVMQEEAPDRVVAALTAEQEGGAHAEGDGHHGGVEAAFVAVLVQAQAGAGLVAVEQAGVGVETREAGSFGRLAGQLAEAFRHGRPGAPLSGSVAL